MFFEDFFLLKKLAQTAIWKIFLNDMDVIFLRVGTQQLHDVRVTAESQDSEFIADSLECLARHV